MVDIVKCKHMASREKAEVERFEIADRTVAEDSSRLGF
jgi:hypothetical protein